MSNKKHYNLNVTEDNGMSLTTTNVSTEHPEELQRILGLAGIKTPKVEPTSDCGCGDTVEIIDSEDMMEAVDIYGNQMPEPNGSANAEDSEEADAPDEDVEDNPADEYPDEDEAEDDSEQLNAEDEDPTDDESKEAEFDKSGPNEMDIEDYSKKTADSISKQKKHLTPGGENPLSYSESVEEVHDALLKEFAMFEAKAKPDFADIDGDGDKKEPMKKAAKDKKKVDEKAKPDFADIDGDGDKKEPMKKAAKDKEKMNESVDLAYLRKLSGL